ncbi:uncharacterized protein LOC122929456 [Bufo gargarizans]|uniref:uncharacterized protein LOC122929456 n=1 Tax=Bufo gargarizans TaxID=30331 RepID=UPI001CF19883|nr:uncharacterized protein LOC122929456 [Bufo gargarizans]XP_044138975.1 uncharacterized protein LOC122929456 [Bufo gargarizans]
MTPMMNNYYFQYQFPVKPIIYPTPPYMSIERDGIEVVRFPVRSRKLMDMIKKFDPNDITYIVDGSFFESLPNDATFIQDTSRKYFVINGESVRAKWMQQPNKAPKFKITFHETREKGVITIQVKDQDLYLSYKPNPDKQLKVLPLGQKSLDFDKPETKEFFFYLSNVNKIEYSIESAKQPGCFISTSTDENVHVTVEPASNTLRKELKFDANKERSNIKCRPNRVRKYRDDTFYWYNDRPFQDKFQSILARDNYIMDATSLALDRSYRWPRQDNLYQSYQLGWRCM